MLTARATCMEIRLRAKKKTEEGLDPTYDENSKPHHPHVGKIIITLRLHSTLLTLADIGQLARHGKSRKRRTYC